MNTLSVSEFKKKCLSLFDKIGQTREQLIITKYGKPVAKIIPYNEDEEPANPLEGSILYEGDLVSPIDEKWNANQ